MMSKTATVRTGAINSVGRIVHSGSGTVARCLTHGLAVMLLALPMLSGLSNEAIAQTAGVTISPTTITIDENGGSDTYAVVLNTVPAGDVEIAVSSDTVSAATVEPMVLTFTTEDWSMAQRVTVTGVNDDTDNPGSREAMLSHSISTGDSGNYPADGSVSIDAVTVTVTDDEPTTITVAIDDRFISESGSAEITVTLDRALVEGEQVTYTLSAPGNDLDYNLTLKSGAGNTGVSLLTTDPYSVTNPGIRLAGANARIATLELTPVDNDVGDEPLGPTILQGGFPVPSSNLDGGHGLVPFSTRLFIVDDDNGLPEVSVIVSRGSPNDLSARETESAGIMLAVHAVIAGVWHEDIDVSVTVTETGGYVTAGTGTLTLRIDQGDAETEAALLTITDDLVDEPDGSVMVMVNAGSGYRVSATDGSWTTRLIDDDPTLVSITRIGGTGNIDEGGTVAFTVTLGRELVAGEVIDVPLQIAGVDTADWSLTRQPGAANPGVTLHDTSTSSPVVRFVEGSRIATLELTAVADGIAETGGVKELMISLGPDDDTAAGFDLGSRQTNVGGGADPDPSADRFTLMIDDVVTALPMVIIAGGAAVMEGTTATFTVTVTPAQTDTLTVSLNVDDVAGSDFVESGNEGSQMVVVPAGQGTVSYSVVTTADDMDEPNSAVTVLVSRGSGSGYTPGSPAEAMVSVIDGDATTVTLQGDPGDVSESSDKIFTLTLGRGLVRGESLTVPLTLTGSATPGTDYTLALATSILADADDIRIADSGSANPTVTFTGPAAGVGPIVARLSVNTIPDGVGNDDGETVQIGLGMLDASSGTGLGGGAIGTGSLAFSIQDRRPILVLPGTLSVDEESSSTYTVALAAEPTADVTVTISGTGFGVTVDTDPDMPSDQNTLTFTSNDWATAQAVTVSAAADDGNRLDERVALRHTATGASEYTRVTGSIVVTVNDNDELPVITIAGGAAVMEGSGDAATFTLTAEPAPTADLTVTVAVAEEVGQDFVGAGDEGTGRSVTIGTSGTAEYMVAITDDDVDESNGTITVTIEAGPEYTVGDPGTATVVVNDNDVAGVTVTQSGGDTEVAESGGTDSYTVVLTSEPAANVEITVTSDDTDISRVAPNGGAFAASTVLTFTATNWNQVQTVRVQGVDDDIDNTSDRTVVIGHAISVPDADSGYPAARDIADVTVTVTDDDTAGLSISETAVTVDEEGTSTYTVALTSQPTADVTVTITGAIASLTVDTGAGTTLTFDDSNWSEMQTVTLTAAGDDDAIDEEPFNLVHTASGSATEYDSVSGDVTVSVIDNDSTLPVVTIAGGAAVTEGSGNAATFTLTAVPAPSADLTVTVEVAEEAGQGQDFVDAGAEGAGRSVTIGTTGTAEYTVAITDDDVDESNGTITVTIEAGTDYTVGDPGTATVVVNDDDTAGLDISEAAVTVDEEGSSTYYTVALTSEPTADVTVTITGASDPLRVDPGTTLTFDGSNWSDVQTVTLTAANDADMDDETFTLEHRASGSATEYDSVSEDVTVRVIDNDSTLPVVSVTATQASEEESAGTLTFTVSVDGVLLSDLNVMLELVGTGTAQGASNAQGLGAVTVTIMAGATEATHLVVLVDDDTVEADGAVTATLQPATGYRIESSESTAEIAVTDDDEVQLSLSSATYTVDEGDMASVTVQLTGRSMLAVPVRLILSDDTAVAGSDYPGTPIDATIAVSADSVSINVPTTEDAVSELSERFSVTIDEASLPDYATRATPFTATVTITDDDEAGVTVDSTTIEVSESMGEAGYTVVLDTEPLGRVEVTVTSTDETVAVVTSASPLIFTTDNWSTAQRVTVAGVDDDRDNAGGMRTATVEHAISADDGGSYTSAVDIDSVTVTVTDDDEAGVMIAQSAGNTVVAELGGMDSYTVVLGSEPAGNIVISVTSGEVTAATAEPMGLTFTTATWNVAQTVTVTGVNDDIGNEGGQRIVTVSHAVTTGDAGSGYPAAVLSIDAVSVTVTDDDEAGVTIAQTGAGTSVAELGGTDSYTVVLNAEPIGDVVIDVTSGEVTAATVEPTALTFTTATWDEAQRVTVTGEDDDIDNAGDGRVVSISHAVRAGSGGYDAVLIAAVSVSVEDDDEASLFLPDVVRVDEASEQSYEVSLGTQPISNVTVTISGSGGATGLTLDDDALTFTAGNWNDPQEVTVSAAPDDDMDNEVVTLMHRASAGYGAPATGQVEVRVTDDDIVRPGVQVSPTQVTVDENGGVSGYDVVLRTRPLGDVEIELSVSGAASAADVGPLSLSFTSTDWNVVQRVRVTGVNDDIDSADRMLDIGHTITTNDGGSYTGSLAIDSVSVRVEDDDEAGAHVNPGIVTVNESAGMDSYTVVLTSQPLGNSTVTIGLASRDSTAALVRPASLSFTSMNWDEAVRVTVTGVNDEVDNAGDVRVLDIVHAVTAGDGVGYRAGATVLPAATVIVEDDGDDAGLLLDVDERNADGTLSLIEQGDSRNYRVRLSSQPLSDVTVTITGAGSSLRVDAGGAGNSLTFTTMNWSEVQTVTLTAVDDGNLSGERVTLLHAASGGGYDGVTGELTVLIADNDRMSGVSIDSDALRVDEAGDMAIYTVVLDAQPSGDVEIGVSSDMTSAATVNPAVLRFTTANWNLRQRVTVTGEDDDIDNAGDGRMALITHRVRLSDGAGYPVDLAIDDVMVSVMDDDEAGLMFEPERVFIAEEGDSRNYRVSLSSQPTGDVSVTVNGAVGGLSVDTGGMPVNSLTFSRMNWRVAQNVMVRAFDDGNEVTETVTLTHTAVGGDYDSVTGRVDVVIADNDRAAGVSVDETVVRVSEGEAVIYTVVLDSEPRSDVEIRVTSSDSRIASVSPLTALTFTSDNWNEPQEVRVSGIDDAIDRADRMVSVDHAVSTGDSGGYNAGLSIESVSVTVLDDDERGLVLNRNTLGVIEDGASVAYTVSLLSQPTGDVTVTVNGAVGGLSVDTGGMPVNSLTFSSMNWRVAQNVMVRAVDDGNEVTETVTLTHTSVGGDYDLMMAQGLMVRIADDESMMAGVSVSERRVTVEESGGTATYRIHLDSPPMGNVVVSVLSTDMQAATVEPLSVGFTPLNWGEEQLVTVTGVDDDVDNGAFRTVRIEHRIVAGDGVGYRTGLSIESLEVRVTDDEGRSAGDIADEEQAQMQAAQEAWLSRFGLTAVEHMLGGLDYRFSSSRRAGLSGNVKGLPNGSAGQALSGEGVGSVRSLGVDGFGHGRAVGVGSGHDGFGAGSVDRLFKLSRSLSLPNMLRGSRFTYTDEGGTSVWGQASYSSYAGSPGEVSLKGDVTTAMLGMDRELGRTLLGLALAYSDGDGDWDDAGSGEFSSKLTSLLPYVRYDVTERLRFWGAASYGQGELEQTSSSGSVSTHDLEQVSASAGLRGTLMQSALEEGGLTLTLISEATLVRTETDDSARMAGMETDTHRFRMGLEWSWQSAETNGIRFTPELELGVRYDGGDTDTGLGIELGGGISWELPSSGLTIDLRGRHLLEHEDPERDEWGISGSLRFKLRPGSSHGPSLSLSQEYGNTTASSGLDRLLSGSLSDAVEEDTSRAGEVSSRWTLKGEWGFALDSGATGVPYAGLSSSGDKRDLTLGWRLSSPGDDLDTKLDVRAMRREKEDGDANHSIGAELKVNW